MSILTSIGGFVGSLFKGDKGIVEQVSDTVDKWVPSKTTIHKQSIEDQKAGDESQDSARKMGVITHDSWLDIAVDAWSRLPRPFMATWAIGVLIGWWEPPEYLMAYQVFDGVSMKVMHPLMGNIIWTIITFYFGSRVIFKDIPSLISKIKAVVSK